MKTGAEFALLGRICFVGIKINYGDINSSNYNSVVSSSSLSLVVGGVLFYPIRNGLLN